MNDNGNNGTLMCNECDTVKPIPDGLLCPTCKTFYCLGCSERITCVVCGDEGGVYCLECHVDHGKYCDECGEFVCDPHWEEHSNAHDKQETETF